MPLSVRLTFDDGPGPSTPLLLDVLKVAGCKVTFFVLGQHLARAPDIATRMLREGHELGNHTWTHARPDEVTESRLANEIEATDALIRVTYEQAGLIAPQSVPLRLPYGLLPDDPRAPVLERLARTHCGWTLILDDWQRPAPSPQTLVDAMRAHIEAQNALAQNTVFCLHDSSRHGDARPHTVDAVRLLLSDADWRFDASAGAH
jgi:peptidoglycan-N-acetylglucosamine deacetylase